MSGKNEWQKGDDVASYDDNSAFVSGAVVRCASHSRAIGRMDLLYRAAE
ncbi:hypothetical protein C5S53_06550 [Methanophagales archaeon]|nr:hypothetical protein C5S53_06550 [Methanophagales archaeon]